MAAIWSLAALLVCANAVLVADPSTPQIQTVALPSQTLAQQPLALKVEVSPPAQPVTPSEMPLTMPRIPVPVAEVIPAPSMRAMTQNEANMFLNDILVAAAQLDFASQTKEVLNKFGFTKSDSPDIMSQLEGFSQSDPEFRKKLLKLQFLTAARAASHITALARNEAAATARPLATSRVESRAVAQAKLYAEKREAALREAKIKAERVARMSNAAKEAAKRKVEEANKAQRTLQAARRITSKAAKAAVRAVKAEEKARNLLEISMKAAWGDAKNLLTSEDEENEKKKKKAAQKDHGNINPLQINVR